MSTVELLAALALATAGLAFFLRALPWPKPWTKVKPLGCPMCMSGWSAFAVLGLAHLDGRLAGWSSGLGALAWLVCVGVAAPLFNLLYPPEVELPLPGADSPGSGN